MIRRRLEGESNRGAPGIDGQDFTDVEAYGVERWLAELALALRQEIYRPEPIRRVFIPKDNGKLRPLGISTVRDRVCMTATMLVLEPIFEAIFRRKSTPIVDLPPPIPRGGSPAAKPQWWLPCATARSQ
jgi:retron-type reverse transcriptase